MKKIDIKAFGEGQQIWFNIGRLRRVEDMLKCPIGEVLQDADKLSLKNLLVLLSVGMSQNGNKTEQYYAERGHGKRLQHCRYPAACCEGCGCQRYFRRGSLLSAVPGRTDR